MIYRRMFGLPDWRLRNRFHELDQMRRQMNRLFGSLTDDSLKKTGSGVFPAINLTENMDNFFLRAELPGVKSEDLDIQATGKNNKERKRDGYESSGTVSTATEKVIADTHFAPIH